MESAERSFGKHPDDKQAAGTSLFARYVEDASTRLAFTRGPKHGLVYANSAFRSLLQPFGDGEPGHSLIDALPGSEAFVLQMTLDNVFRTKAAVEHRGDYAPGNWLHGRLFRVWPLTHEDGVDGLGIEVIDNAQSGTGQDLQRQLAERMLLAALRESGAADIAEAARKRAAFLAHAGRLLAESLDRASTLIALTRLALPFLGAWCIVDILGDDGKIQRLGIFHPDPDGQKLATQLEGHWVPEPDDPFGAPAMVRSAEPLMISDSIDITIAAAANGEENLRILRQLEIEAVLTVPLIARGKLLGAITFIGTRTGNNFVDADVDLAVDLAARAAMALDSAQMHETALKLRVAAEAANRAKTSFLGAMSHELRTPLNAIGGYVELIDMGLRGPVTKEQHVDLARVKASQQHLLILITEILNFVRVGSGRVSYDISDFNASGALTRAVELIEPLVTRKGLRWEGVRGDSTALARADPEKVTQILVNLLSNAIKFTEAGDTLSVDCVATADTVLLRIADTGAGIAAEKFEAIFEPFVQLKEGLAGREAGVGLGLAISRDLARAMKGDLSVESVEGKGARFTLTLPRGFKSETETASRAD